MANASIIGRARILEPRLEFRAVLIALPIYFATPAAGWLALALAAAAGGIAWKRRLALPALTQALVAAGLIAFALAAGGAGWGARSAPTIDVWVDLSPSTRTASFRQRIDLSARVRELLGGAPYRLLFFSDGQVRADADATQWADVPCARTRFFPEAAPAVMLFSDGRFRPPDFAPPIFAVLDPALQAPVDAAVDDILPRGDDVAIALSNRGSPRPLALSGVGPPAAAVAEPGHRLIATSRAAGAAWVIAQLAPGDAWPENDRLALPALPPWIAERWWVGGAPPDGAWRAMTPSELPAEPAAYLAAQVIVLNDLPEDSLSPVVQQRLQQHVRDLGGGLVVIASAQPLDANTLGPMLPLAPDPPAPASHWIVLLDASGSMSADAGGQSRWRVAAGALADLVPHLPPADFLSVGRFAAGVRWQAEHTPVVAFTPASESPPGGPTNLRAALESALVHADPALPNELLAITDGDADLGPIEPLREALAQRRMRLHVLAIGPNASPQLKELAAGSGGGWREQTLPGQWAEDLRKIYLAARPRRERDQAVRVDFVGPLAALPAGRATRWQQAWQKERAEIIARGDPGPLGARWRFGEGQAAALAFAPAPAELEAVVALAARPARDPRFLIQWDARSTLRVRIDAADADAPLNGQALTLRLVDLSNSAPQDVPILQTGPGRYEATIENPVADFASVRLGGRELATRALPRRYAAEFEAIGNDRAALAELARRSGGRLIEPGDRRKLDLSRPVRRISLISPLAGAGAFLIAAGLLRWRRGATS